MLQAARDAAGIIKDASRESVIGNRVRMLAPERSLELIGEAARRVSDAVRRKHPKIRMCPLSASKEKGMIKHLGKVGNGLVLVEWLDSRQPTNAWMRVGDLQRECCRCYSAGFVVQRDAQVIVLAPNVADVDDEPQASGVMLIPRVAVVRVTPLVTTSDALAVSKRKRRRFSRP